MTILILVYFQCNHRKFKFARDCVVGRQYTSARRRSTPTYKKLDRVLASVEWEQKFPLVSVRALTRSGSDHTPLLIDTGRRAHIGNKTCF
jgi:endonuclease/exonuclease/phosphatase family metal-dependent hydrolase